MWKLALVTAAITAAVGTTAVVAVTRSDEPKPVAAVSVPPPPLVVKSGSATTHAAPAPAITPLDKRDMEVGESGIKMYDHPDVISKAERDRLNIEQGPSRGPANAPVTIVVYQDLMCSYCGKVLGTIDQIWDEYPGKLRLVVKQFPVHAAARLAAEASFAADAQGKFWELHDAMFANQDDLTRDAIVGYAKQAGLDATKLAAALDHHTYEGALAKEVDAAKEIGIRATPEFLINGQDFTGARPVEDFRAAIDAALADAAL